MSYGLVQVAGSLDVVQILDPKGDMFEWLGFLDVVKNEVANPPRSGLRPPPKAADPLIWFGGGQREMGGAIPNKEHDTSSRSARGL